jgi:aspartyl-tRNA(Asn)/glutamyl-tRNA(Gln) amidotransferase subunit A
MRLSAENNISRYPKSFPTVKEMPFESQGWYDDMTHLDPNSFSIGSLRKALALGETNAREVCRATYEHVESQDSKYHAFLSLTRERAEEHAAFIDSLPQDNRPPLAGIPIALKDNLLLSGSPTTCGSKILSNYLAHYDATVTQRLEKAGALIIGKTNLDEFAMGSSTENSAFFPTLNPHDVTRVPGGSSGGSAVAVAAGMVVGALGSDTGGSIRQPAAMTGVVGLKPTYGRVSRFGLVAFGSSLDQIGPFGRSVHDVAEILKIIAGHDPHDSTSVPVPVPDYPHSLARDVKGLIVGVPWNILEEGIEPDVKRNFTLGIRLLEQMGCAIEAIELPHSKYAIDVYYVVAPAEASSNLARFDGVRYGLRSPGAGTLSEMYRKTRHDGFGAEVKRRIMLGTYALSSGYYDAYYLKAQKVRTLIARDFKEAFTRVHVIAMPTSPFVAFKLGEKMEDPLSMYLSDIFTITANLAGIPGISLPCGKDHQALPIGLQFLGRPFDELTLLQLSFAFEQSGGFNILN